MGNFFGGQTAKESNETAAAAGAGAGAGAGARVAPNFRNTASPWFTIHHLLNNDFVLTEVIHFLDVESTLRFSELFSES